MDAMSPGLKWFFFQWVNTEPNKVSADQDPKDAITDYRDFSKNSTAAAIAITSEAMRPKFIWIPKVTIGW